jgi:hypothetical protein
MQGVADEAPAAAMGKRQPVKTIAAPAAKMKPAKQLGFILLFEK